MSYLAIVKSGFLDSLNYVGVRFNEVAKTFQIFNLSHGSELPDVMLLEWPRSASGINRAHANYRGEGKIPEVR